MGSGATIQQHFEAQREREWKRAGVSDADIQISRESGMDARDVRAFREFSSRGSLIVVRCPKVVARVWHGYFPPKPWHVKTKTGEAGLVGTEKGDIYVSDYDLMCIWKASAKGYEKVFVSAAGGATHGRWLPEACAIVVEMNKLLVSRIQHGCQDDFESPKNPGVKPTDHFAAFYEGAARHFASPAACADFYAENDLPWPYDKDGKYILPAR